MVCLKKYVIFGIGGLLKILGIEVDLLVFCWLEVCTFNNLFVLRNWVLKVFEFSDDEGKFFIFEVGIL